MRQRRRIAAYGVCRDEAGQVLLIRAGTADGATWALPGGELEHGESPAAAVVRWFAAQTGLAARVVGLRDVDADVAVRDGVELVHTDRIRYDVAVTGDLRTDLAAWHPDEPQARVGDSTEVPPSHPVREEPVTRVQRFAAYGLTTNVTGGLLLTRIADGYPGAGSWHLPGGGTDFGEQPVTGLLRELLEETGQLGRVTGLLDVVDRWAPQALGPEGYPIDWHAVRAVYRVLVEAPRPLTVVEPVGGSTAEARWVDPAELDKLPLNGFAKGTIARHLGQR